MRKPEAENPKYVYNICHRDHVTILIQSWTYQALSTIQSLHTIMKKTTNLCTDFLPPDTLPLLRNPC